MEMLSNYIDFNFQGLLILASGYINFGLGIFILSKNIKSRLNQSFFLVTFASMMWLNGFGWYALIKPIDLAMIFTYSTYFFGVPFISPAVYLFSCALLKKENLYKYAYIGFAFSFLLMIRLSFFGDSLLKPAFYPWGKYVIIIPTFFNIFYETVLLSHFFIFAAFSFRNFYIGWKKAITKTEKIQFRNLLFGYLIAYTGAVDFLTVFGFNIYPFGYISISIYIGIIAYTIFKHQLLEINLTIRRFSAGLIIYIGLLMAMIPMALPLINFILNNPNQYTPIFVLLSSLVIGLFFSIGPIIYAYLIKNNFWLRGHVATGLTHELKSPLSNIQSAVDILSQTTKTPNTEYDNTVEYLDMIRRNTNRLEKSVADLINISKIQDEDINLNKSVFEIGPLMESIKNIFKPALDQKNLRLLIDTGSVQSIYADKEKFNQVISNLLSNAVKYSSGKEIKIIFHKSNQFLMGTVINIGSFINKGDLPHIFDRFYQGKNARKGSGVGLSIVKAWIFAHKGKIWVEQVESSNEIRFHFTMEIGKK